MCLELRPQQSVVFRVESRAKTQRAEDVATSCAFIIVALKATTPFTDIASSWMMDFHSRIDCMSGNELNLKGRGGNTHRLPDHSAGKSTKLRDIFRFSRRQLILTFVVLNLLAWAVVLAIIYF